MRSVATYRSFGAPCVFFALRLAGQAFSAVSIMCVIALTGMDLTTAILFIVLITKHRESGIPRNKAVVAACLERLRPILMTSTITFIAMAPVAFAPKTGVDAYQSLETVIIGGLIIGTAPSLLAIPIMHTIVLCTPSWTTSCAGGSSMCGAVTQRHCRRWIRRSGGLRARCGFSAKA